MQGVFPTPVGVFLGLLIVLGYSMSLPHARGGVSKNCYPDYATPGSSPRPWGCFLFTKYFQAVVDVFPTPVGVFPLMGLDG